MSRDRKSVRFQLASCLVWGGRLRPEPKFLNANRLSSALQGVVQSHREKHFSKVASCWRTYEYQNFSLGVPRSGGPQPRGPQPGGPQPGAQCLVLAVARPKIAGAWAYLRLCQNQSFDLT